MNEQLDATPLAVSGPLRIEGKDPRRFTLVEPGSGACSQTIVESLTVRGSLSLHCDDWLLACERLDDDGADAVLVDGKNDFWLGTPSRLDLISVLGHRLVIGKDQRLVLICHDSKNLSRDLHIIVYTRPNLAVTA